MIKTQGGNTKKILAELNRLNDNNIFVKFCFDPSDNTIQAGMDAIFTPDTVGPLCYKLLPRTVMLTDTAYPLLMRALSI